LHEYIMKTSHTHPHANTMEPEVFTRTPG